MLDLREQPALRRNGLMRIRLGLLANALHWRAGSSSVFCLVALLAVAAATAGPVYLAAADQSVLEHVVIPPPPDATGLLVNPQPGLHTSLAQVREDLRALPRSSSGRPFFGRVIFAEIAESTILGPAGDPLAVSDMVSRSQVCAHLAFTRGQCPTGPAEVALSTRSASYLRLGVGSVVRLSVGSSVLRFKVSGLYRAGSFSAPYWWGSDYFLFGSAQSPPPRMDDLFVDPSAFVRLPPAQVAVNADVPVATSALLSTQVPAFRQALRNEEVHLGSLDLDANSGIGSYLDEVTSQQQAMTTTVAVIDLQLLILVLMVLFGIAGRVAAQRDQDLDLANLRGLSRRSLWAVAMREPLALMIVAAPLGAFVGWLVAFAMARTELVARVTVGFDSLAFAAALAASVAAVGATAAASRRALQRSAGRAATLSRRDAALRLTGEAFVVALAFAALVQLSASGVGTKARSQPLAALAPGLIALAVGLVAARVVPLLCRIWGNMKRYSPQIGLSLALRRVARQSSIIRQSVVIAIAVSLACFAVAGFWIDRSNRDLQAAFLVGANRVLTVSVPGNVDFVQAVRDADPSGHEAMAVEVEANQQGTLLAVDAARFASVAAWESQPGAGTAAALARYLNPHVAPAVIIQGDNIEVTADLRAALQQKPSLVLGIYNEQYGAASSFTVGPLSFGRHEYFDSLQGDCVSACRLTSITATWPGPPIQKTATRQSATIPVEIQKIAEDDGPGYLPVSAGLSHAGSWRVTQEAPGAPSMISSSPSGLLVSFDYVIGQAPPAVAPADVPVSLPAVVTDTVASLQTGGPTGSTLYSVLNLDGSLLPINGAVHVAAIPSVGTNAVMVDLTDALRDETLPDIDSTRQVWLSAAAGSGASIVRRLRHDGIGVISVSTVRSFESAFGQDGPTLAFDLFLVVGLESALLATGSILFSVVSASRERAVETVALRSVGLPRRTLVGAMARELGIVCATGLVAGVVAGAAAARFSLHSVPEFTGLSPGPTLDFNLPLLWIVLVTAAAAGLLALAVIVSIGLVTAAATPDKLRISQR